MTLRVLVVDDQALVRRGFAMVLEHQGDIEVVGEAGTGVEAVALARELAPDVVLMDIRMPELDGIEATARILAESGEHTRVIVLTTFDPDEYIYRALRAGASGFLLKDIPPEELVAAVRAVADGGALLGPGITRRLIEQFARQGGANAELAERIDRLTGRERDVLSRPTSPACCRNWACATAPRPWCSPTRAGWPRWARRGSATSEASAYDGP